MMETIITTEPVTTITITEPVTGKVDFNGPPFIVPAGVYEIVDTDSGEAFAVDIPGVVDGVWVDSEAVGLAPCPGCSGHGHFSYRVYGDEFDTESCDHCDTTGMVTAAEAAELNRLPMWAR